MSPLLPPAPCITRLPGWPERLAAFIESRRHTAFAWGRNDCATFAADALLATTGTDVLASLRGTWASEPEAAAVLARMGGLPRAAMACLGRPLRHAAAAPRGAVVLARMGRTVVLGLRLSSAQWCAPGAAGLLFRPAAEVRLAWGCN